MSGKVKCSCGHSWSKSDSSKKDMNVCHICGKDNTMEDGGWLDKYQVGGEASKYIQNVPKTFGKGIAKTDATKVTNKLKPTNAQLVTQEELDEREAQARRDRISVANAVQPYMFNSPKNFAVANSAIGDNLRVSDYPNVFDDYVNPASMFGHFASGLGQVPLNVQEGNYGQAAMNVAAPVVAGAAETIISPLISKGLSAGKKAAKSAIDRNFTQVGKQLADIERKGIAKGLSPQAIKNQQMQQVGITSMQREGYVPGVSEVFSEYITPYSYDNPARRILDIPRRIVTGEKNSKNLSDIDVDFIFNGIEKGQIAKPRYDAWRMYSGLPQEYGTFRLAETSPINHPSYSAEQLSKLEKFSLNDEKKLLRDLPSEYDADLSYLENSELVEALPELKNKLKEIQELKAKGIGNAQSDFTSTGVMGGYNRRFFDNKMEYNDVWDLNLKGIPVDKYFGKPFMSHGQLDYSFQPAEDALTRSIRTGEYYKGLGDNITKPKMEFFDANKKFNNLKQFNPKDITVNKKENGGWLEKYNDGGPIQPNYNDYSVSAGPGFQGDGYSNVGRNYSPAWGGQFKNGGSLSLPTIKDEGHFNKDGVWIPDWKAMAAQAKKLGAKKVKTDQGGIINFNDKWEAVSADDSNTMAMGGSIGGATQGIPGATGFMYARTGSIPSNGKYAKKTKASAQNGMEMKYYQDGLDFKPKSISKNGSVIKDDMGQWAHPGEITEIGSNQITMKGVPYPVLGISDTGDMQMMYPDEEYQYDGESVTEIPMMREGGTISKKTLARNQRIAESNAAQNQPLTPESLATRAIAIPDKLRLSEQMRNVSPGLASWMEENPRMSYIDENLNPLVIAGKLASKLGQVPLNVKQGNYRQALLNTISPMLVRASATGAVTTENLSNSKNKFEQGGQLTKLDQLTNFTNYNTKQPGGWLDKYQ